MNEIISKLDEEIIKVESYKTNDTNDMISNDGILIGLITARRIVRNIQKNDAR